MTNDSATVTIAVDIKRNRIRLHRKMLYMLDRPKYVQLLVNPETRNIAIRAIAKPKPEDQAEKIPSYKLSTDIEFYSQSFIQKLCELIGDLDSKHTYRCTGKVIPKQNIAVFSLDTVTCVEP